MNKRAIIMSQYPKKMYKKGIQKYTRVYEKSLKVSKWK